MADAEIKMKIMPDSVEADLEMIKTKAIEVVKAFEPIGEVKTSEEPVAFGLKAVMVEFVIDENKGTDEVEERLSEIEFVNSVEVAAYSRTLG